MNIFCTCSSDITPRGSYEDYIKSAGHEIVSGDVRALLGADALFICISGKENREIKEDLNLALDRGLPVAYVIEDGGVVDPGLSIQLAIASRIPADSGKTPENREQDRTAEAEKPEPGKSGAFEENHGANDAAFDAMSTWLETVSRNIVSGRKRKNIRIIACVLIAFILTAGVFALACALMDRQGTDTAEPELTVEEQLGIDFEMLKTCEKIDLSEKGLEDISFLSGCKACTELDISGNAISDISVLSELENIRVLNISGNRIDDINVLLALKNLKEVDISDNPIKDYTATSFLGNAKVKQ